MEAFEAWVNDGGLGKAAIVLVALLLIGASFSGPGSKDND